MVQKIFLGNFSEQDYPHLNDARTTEWVAIAGLAVTLIAVGVYPRPLVDLIDVGLHTVPGIHAPPAVNSLLSPPAAPNSAMPSSLAE
jgi:NADH:ubiquinone oxidoreductase subunit 4 (subunit M)